MLRIFGVGKGVISWIMHLVGWMLVTLDENKRCRGWFINTLTIDCVESMANSDNIFH